MPIDVVVALSAKPSVQTVRWTERDVLLYHLSIGAGSDPVDAAEQKWVYERDLRVLPTFALVAGKGISSLRVPLAARLPGVDVPPARLLHAGQELSAHRPIEPCGTAVVTSRISDVWDVGTAALIEMVSVAETEAGEPIWTNKLRVWAGGEGGQGEPLPPQDQPERPDRAPDAVITRETRADQALLYRLNGGVNPLHVDPIFARKAGFERPTLHGAATYGVAYKALVDTMLGGDAGAADSFSARFSGYMLPGHSLRISVWQEDHALLMSATCPERGGVPVLTNGRMVLC